MTSSNSASYRKKFDYQLSEDNRNASRNVKVLMVGATDVEAHPSRGHVMYDGFFIYQRNTLQYSVMLLTVHLTRLWKHV